MANNWCFCHNLPQKQVLFGMKCRQNAVFFAVKDFMSAHKKTFLCFLIVFLAGMVVGIVTAVNSVGGEFVRLSKNDMVFGAVKVFFFSSLFLFAGYGVVILSTTCKGISFIAVFPFVVLGYFFGEYMTVLIGAYGGVGLMNLLFVYLPFYLLTFCCLSISGCIAQKSNVICANKNRILKPSVSILLKGYAINVICSFTIFMLIGSVTKVVVVSI